MKKPFKLKHTDGKKASPSKFFKGGVGDGLLKTAKFAAMGPVGAIAGRFLNKKK